MDEVLDSDLSEPEAVVSKALVFRIADLESGFVLLLARLELGLV